MSRTVSIVVSSFVAVALHVVVAGSAFAQDPPAVEPSAAEPPSNQPPPVAQQTAASAGSVFDLPGFDFGARLGYALPMGNADADSKLSDGISGAIPIVLEAGYRINPNLTVGALFQYGIARIKDSTTCNTSGVDCSGSVMRLGVEAIYNLNLASPLSPWVGVGTGYEWFGTSVSAGGQSASVTAKGFEFVTLHAGGDYRLAPNFALGPFLSFSVGQYGSVSTPNGGGDITDKGIHEWIQLGVRGRFGI